MGQPESKEVSGQPAGVLTSTEINSKVLSLAVNMHYGGELDRDQAPPHLVSRADVKNALRILLLLTCRTESLECQDEDDAQNADWAKLSTLEGPVAKVLHCLTAQTKAEVDTSIRRDIYPKISDNAYSNRRTIQELQPFWAAHNFTQCDPTTSVTDYSYVPAITGALSTKVRKMWCVKKMVTGCWALVQETCGGDGPGKKPEDTRASYMLLNELTKMLPSDDRFLAALLVQDCEVPQGSCLNLNAVWVDFRCMIAPAEGGMLKNSQARLLQAARAHNREIFNAYEDKLASYHGPSDFKRLMDRAGNPNELEEWFKSHSRILEGGKTDRYIPAHDNGPVRSTSAYLSGPGKLPQNSKAKEVSGSAPITPRYQQKCGEKVHPDRVALIHKADQTERRDTCSGVSVPSFSGLISNITASGKPAASPAIKDAVDASSATSRLRNEVTPLGAPSHVGITGQFENSVHIKRKQDGAEGAPDAKRKHVFDVNLNI